MRLSLPANATLLFAFGDEADPRKQRNQSYPLIDIIMRFLIKRIYYVSKENRGALKSLHLKDESMH